VRLTAPRVNTVSSHYYKKAELDTVTFKRTNKALIKALEGGRQLTRGELREIIKRAGIEPGDSMRFGYIMHRSELDGVVCSGARRGKQFTYSLLDERAPRSRELEKDEALGELTERYFSTRGPATIQDYVWWSGLTTTQAKRGLEIAGKYLRTAVIDGKSFSLSAGRAITPSTRVIRAYLLPAYDEYFISYKDRTAAIHRDFDQKTMATKLVFDAPLVIDGQAVGGWSRVIGHKLVTVHLRPFIELTKPARTAVTRAAESYASFLERDLRVEWVR
jgi:hypothetical protein